MISDTNEIIEKVLIDEESLNLRIKKLASYINEHYKDEDTLIMVAILKGSVMFMAELAKYIKVDTNLEFMAVSSYESGTESSGNVKILKDLDTDITDKNVLIRDPKEIKIITLLDKPERREVEIKPDWYGFKIPNEFVVGFGLDYDQRLRNLPYIGVLKREVYEK